MQHYVYVNIHRQYMHIYICVCTPVRVRDGHQGRLLQRGSVGTQKPTCHVCVCVCMYVCMYVCMHACMHACMYVCMRA
jgi:hypothetical protein